MHHVPDSYAPTAPGDLTEYRVLFQRCEQGNRPVKPVQVSCHAPHVDTDLLHVRCIVVVEFYQTIWQEPSMPQAIY